MDGTLGEKEEAVAKKGLLCRADWHARETSCMSSANDSPFEQVQSCRSTAEYRRGHCKQRTSDHHDKEPRFSIAVVLVLDLQGAVRSSSEAGREREQRREGMSEEEQRQAAVLGAAQE
jgi:hypothetical protein